MFKRRSKINKSRIMRSEERQVHEKEEQVAL